MLQFFVEGNFVFVVGFKWVFFMSFRFSGIETLTENVFLMKNMSLTDRLVKREYD